MTKSEFRDVFAAQQYIVEGRPEEKNIQKLGEALRIVSIAERGHYGRASFAQVVKPKISVSSEETKTPELSRDQCPYQIQMRAFDAPAARL